MRVRARARVRRTLVTTVAAVAAAALLLAGCAQDPDEGPDQGSPSTGASGGGAQTTLTVGVFGAFGLQEAGLYDAYMAQNPGIRIEQTSIERNENYYPQLLTHLGTGSGLADIQAVEVNNIAEITATQADKLVDLAKAPGVDKAAYLPWKWAQGTAPAAKGGATVGLGTDIGPQGICYRKDLFEAAGLPTDRTAVGALWAGDWNKYLETGRTYEAKAGEGKSFVDSASGVMAAVTGSSAQRFYDDQGKVVYKTNPAVRGAFDLAASFATDGLSAKLQQFTPAWDQGFSNGSFATVSCPAWMLGYIQDKAGPAGKDKWDVAQAPKPSNWGGSFLVVPKAGKHAEEAAKLAAWLTAPAQQAKLFEKRGSFPSASAAYKLPTVSGAQHAYFGGAPIGEIFAKAAEGVPVAAVGPKDLVIAQNLADIGMLQVDQKGRSPQEGWEAAVKAIDNALDQ
ncbi:extracellular solute-binding protein [Streptomyces sp. NBC_00853]|uniref:ABC transporter substrate-binding protein n=1 Tax=Streptomyces sp. NBC_00853 TaxID=2903681 RepID=UPI0038733EF0|nr:extracellular solute-binding protein [Streptomyces sp. NBC_00853]